ncbi:hypothetical protein DFQ26_003233 [Actinomortierella ambigua]|nr:hypothetical protein DFQ26_003233 [Actinomortierella ambigua]
MLIVKHLMPHGCKRGGEHVLSISQRVREVEVIVKPEREVAWNWSAMIDTATMGDLMKSLVGFYPHPSELIRHDEDLRRILKVVKAQPVKQLTISLAAPTKDFPTWTFKGVVSDYNLADSTAVGLEVLPPFTDIQTAPLNSDLEKTVLEHLIKEVELRVDVLKLLGANEAARSMVVASFLLAATTLFEEDLYLASQQRLGGRRGSGAVDYVVRSRMTHLHILCVTEVKKEHLSQGVAQNIIQMETALSTKKRKRGMYEIDGEERESQISNGIVTDASQWLLLECTLHEDKTVTFRMKCLEQFVSYGSRWQDDVRFVFERLVCLWSRTRDEMPVRERYSRNTTSALSVRKTDS